MKLRNLFTFTVVILLLLPSCIKEEGLYREADIVKFSLSPEIMLMPTIINQKGNNRIEVIVYDTTYMKNGVIIPEIEVSPGAIISPASGEHVILEDYKATYIVTAANGDKKTYTVSILPIRPQKYDFDNWYEVDKNPKRVYDMLSDPLWSNANAGVVMLYRNYEPFPTRRTTDCRKGEYGMLLETVFGNRSSIIYMMDIPIYAGSAFRGIFDTDLSNPLRSAKFGQIHSKSEGKPIRFLGWYKYQSGDIYQTCTVVTSPKKQNIVEYFDDIKDELDIYAVLFKVPLGNEGKDIYLTAEDVQTSDRIIAKAILEDRTEKAGWTRFNIPFTYTEEMDYSQYDYKLAIVFSSSRRGAFYEGAIGSILHIDEVEIVTEPIE